MRNPYLLFALVLSVFSLHAEEWEERAWRQINKKMTCEFSDTKLSDSIDFVANFTGLNIIINPKVLKADLHLSLRVTDMDAGTVIKWLTKLTDTYAEVQDKAIYITDKPSPELAEADKNELLIMAAVARVEIELPAPGVPLTEMDIMKVAMKLAEKENVKPTDFPGPELTLEVPVKK